MIHVQADVADLLSAFSSHERILPSEIAFGPADRETETDLPRGVILGHVVSVEQETRLDSHLVERGK